MDPLMTFLTWLVATPVAGAMRRSPWSCPIVETAHILGFVFLIGAPGRFIAYVECVPTDPRRPT